MTKRKTAKQVEANISEVAQELLNGDQTNLETLQEVISNGVSTMKVHDPFGLLKNDEVETPAIVEVKVRITVGATAIKLILENPELSNAQVLEKVKEAFPTAQTTMACIAWYKSKLRKEGKIGQRVFAKKVAQVAAE